MLKKLFDFKVSKQMRLAKILVIVGLLAAIAIAAVGIREIMNVKAMKEVLGVTKLIMGDVLVFLLKEYLGWALLIVAAVLAVYVAVRYQENKKAAAA